LVGILTVVRLILQVLLVFRGCLIGHEIFIREGRFFELLHPSVPSSGHWFMLLRRALFAGIDLLFKPT
jgi:hypothetical protein